MLRAIAQAVASQPALYQVIQVVSGQRRSVRELRRVLARLSMERTLDVGSAAGAIGRQLFGRAFGVDIDPRPLAAMKRGHPEARAIAASAAALPFRDDAFTMSVCIAVSHHLDDETLRNALRDIARVTAGRFVFLDAIRNDARWVARTMWRYDRGRFPRSRDDLLRAIAEFFVIEEKVEYQYLHQYLLLVAVPRAVQ